MNIDKLIKDKKPILEKIVKENQINISKTINDNKKRIKQYPIRVLQTFGTVQIDNSQNKGMVRKLEKYNRKQS